MCLNLSHKNKAIKVLELIIQKITSTIISEQHAGLFTGMSGQLLFLVYAEMSIPNSVDNKLIQNCIDKIQRALKSQSLNMGLTSGVSGIGLTLELIQRIIDEPANLNESLDLHLISVLEDESEQIEYELLQGLTGVLLYALNRSQWATGEKLLNIVLEQLINKKIELSEGLAWPTHITSNFRFSASQDVEFNLGLAHGNAGTLGVLTKVYQKYPTEKLREVIKNHAYWMLSQGIVKADHSYFGYCNNDEKNSRLAWCYGDLCNSLVLWHAGKILGNDFIMNTAQKIALVAASLKLESSGVVDMALCHGAGGNAVIFQSLYFHMKLEPLKKASIYWYTLLLDSTDTAKGLDSLWQFNSVNNSYQENFNLLEGYAGIGLALLSSLDFDSSWQTCLLMD
ncbi:hypothetical protein PSECIP111854_00468 [Pseudoalteromonas sp. CIP111854]|uniref:Lantibiotic biosynthesis protein n=1 Tax=Pseudoalteromonas holothuriae TaxID=2963714 RepID=A0A9W4QRU0_9GAMM|nr:lanthionine synthetase LanC family protein [Pseudoalteromonas sp. CIP111854]CAH9050137.1 hypothetical protein PSECIP111854_00468 [Pseudoalteromonas sp. CIP111854]